MCEGSAGIDHRGDDAHLLERWLGGDSEAARRLIARHVAALNRYFRAQQPGDADDLLQETLLALIEARGRFRGDASFRTFLFRIAKYQLWSHRRKQSSSQLVMNGDAIDLGANPANKDDVPECDALDEARKRLSPVLSEVIALTLERRLTRDAIARQLGVSPGTVASRMRLAKAQLRELLLERMAG